MDTPLVTLTIAVNRDGTMQSDVQTHDNSYADVAIGLAAAKREIERVFIERQRCPYYPSSTAQAQAPIVRDKNDSAPAGSLVRRERMELELRRDQMTRFPFCPDHRDKVLGLSCRQCEIERLTRLVERAGVQPPGGSTEPVAWRFRYPLDQGRWNSPVAYFPEAAKAEGAEVQPLYMRGVS